MYFNKKQIMTIVHKCSNNYKTKNFITKVESNLCNKESNNTYIILNNHNNQSSNKMVEAQIKI